jgi:hypothetical protein
MSILNKSAKTITDNNIEQKLQNTWLSWRRFVAHPSICMAKEKRLDS